jgi:hypothetical protein
LLGRALNGTADSEIFGNYALRVATIEGMRRAALLTADLRASGVTAEVLPQSLNVSETRNPFTLEAFEWSAEEGAVIYQGREPHDQNRHVFYF